MALPTTPMKTTPARNKGLFRGHCPLTRPYKTIDSDGGSFDGARLNDSLNM